MSLEIINNGTFNNDPAAEIIRLAFGKVNEMFTEIYGKVPLELTGESGKILVVKATEDGFELVSLTGGGDMLRSNNLGDLTNVAQARTELGLGSAAVTDSTDYATAAQGVKADSAIQAIVAGTGISVDVTDPQNPILEATGAGDYVVSGVVDYANDRIRLTLLSGGNVDVPFVSKPVIDGLIVDKGAGTNYAAIEVGDFCSGWEGTSYVAFRVDGLPYTTEANRSYALNNEI
jgi:hypothetical protein